MSQNNRTVLSNSFMASTKALSEELLDSKGTFIRTMKLTNRLQSTLHSNTHAEKLKQCYKT